MKDSERVISVDFLVTSEDVRRRFGVGLSSHTAVATVEAHLNTMPGLHWQIMYQPAADYRAPYADEKTLRNWASMISSNKMNFAETLQALDEGIKGVFTKHSKMSDQWEVPALPPLTFIREIARTHGYAIANHGSENRDYDLIAAPWVERASSPEELVDALCVALEARICGGPAEDKPHGRYAVTLQMLNAWAKNIDLSIMPRQAQS